MGELNFNDLPCDIKSKIFKINKDREKAEHLLRQLILEINYSRIIYKSCDCEGCNYKNYYGCYDAFRGFNYRHKLTHEIITFSGRPT